MEILKLRMKEMEYYGEDDTLYRDNNVGCYDDKFIELVKKLEED